MDEKKCCGIYDYDGVLVPGEILMDEYIKDVCPDAMNSHEEQLIQRQIELTKEELRLIQERNIHGLEMREVKKELDDIAAKLDRHFMLKDQVLEETEPKYKNIIDYDEIYRLENVYPGVLETLWQIYDRGVYHILINNTHTNVDREEKAKLRLLAKEFPPMVYVPVLFHTIPYRGPNGLINHDRDRSDKVQRMISNHRYINPLISTYVDNSPGVIKCAKKQGLRTYFVDKEQDPRDHIIEAANDTIDIVHEGKIKRLSR